MHLIKLGVLTEDEHTRFVTEAAEQVKAAGRESEALGTLREGARIPASTMFDDVYQTMPDHLVAQRAAAGV